MENEKIHRKGALQTCLLSWKGLGLLLKVIKLKMRTWFNQNSFSDYQSKLKLKSAYLQDWGSKIQNLFKARWSLAFSCSFRWTFFSEPAKISRCFSCPLWYSKVLRRAQENFLFDDKKYEMATFSSCWERPAVSRIPFPKIAEKIFLQKIFST